MRRGLSRAIDMITCRALALLPLSMLLLTATGCGSSSEPATDSAANSASTGGTKTKPPETKPAGAPTESEPSRTRESEKANDGSRKLESPPTHGGFFAFAFSPDGSLVAGTTGTIRDGRTKELLGGGEVVLWDPRSGRLAATLGTHLMQPAFETDPWPTTNFLAFSGNGQRLISASRQGGTIVVWDVRTGSMLWEKKLPARLHAGNFQRPALAINHDGTIVAAVTEERIAEGDSELPSGGKLTCWDVDTSAVLWSLDESRMRSLAIRNDGRLAGLVERSTTYVHPKTGKPRRGLAFEVIVRNCSDGANEKKWPGQPLLNDHPQWLSIVPHSLAGPPSRIALMGDYGMTIHDIDSGALLHRLAWDTERTSFISHRFSDDGQFLARQGFSGEWVERIEIATGRLTGLQEREFHDGRFGKTAFSPDLSKLASQINQPTVLPFPETGSSESDGSTSAR